MKRSLLEGQQSIRLATASAFGEHEQLDGTLANRRRLFVQPVHGVVAVAAVNEEGAPTVGGRKEEEHEALGHYGRAANDGPQVSEYYKMGRVKHTNICMDSNLKKKTTQNI